MSKILDSLIAAGVPSEIVLAVAELIAKDRIITERRANDAARQQRHRLRNATSRDVELRHMTSCDPPVHIPSPQEKKEPKRVLSTQLPSDWILPDAYRVFASDKSWDSRKTEFEAERFKNHAHASGRKAKDWFAAWRNWVTSPYQNSTQVNGKANGHRTIMAAADDLLERVRGFDAPAPSGLRDGTRAADARLLPKG